MTYFYTLVLLPPETSALSQEQVYDLLYDQVTFPYHGAFPDQPYEYPCYCLRTEEAEAYEAGVAAANQQEGRFSKIARAYVQEPEDQRPAWRDYPPYRRWLETAEKAARAHPAYRSPKPDCELCQGSGRWETTENPDSEFDFWADEDMDLLFVGSEVMFYVNKMPAHLLGEAGQIEALLTPDGEWHGIDWANDEGSDQWADRLREMVSLYPAHIAVRMLMHR